MAEQLTILRRKQVEAHIGIARSTIYAKLDRDDRRFDPTFPRAINLGAHSIGWIEAAIDVWITKLIEASREEATPPVSGPEK